LLSSGSLSVYYEYINKRENRKGQSRMDNPEILATLGTQETGRRQQHNIKHNTQKNKIDEPYFLLLRHKLYYYIINCVSGTSIA